MVYFLGRLREAFLAVFNALCKVRYVFSPD